MNTLPLALQRALDRSTAAVQPDFPWVDAKLVDSLDRRFPLEAPQVDATLAEVQRAAGQRDVINYLRAVLAVQEAE